MNSAIPSHGTIGAGTKETKAKSKAKNKITRIKTITRCVEADALGTKVSERNRDLSLAKDQLLTNDILLNILRRVTSYDGSFAYALVCRRWHALSRFAQVAVSLREGAQLSQALLLRQVSKFPNLTSLTLRASSVKMLSDAFVSALCSALPDLHNLEISEKAVVLSNTITSAGIAAALRRLTALQSLELLAADVNRQRQIMVIPPPGGAKKLRCLRLTSSHDRSTRASMFLVQSLPESFWEGFSALRELAVRSDSVESLPSSVTRMVHLRELQLNAPSLRLLPEEFGQLTHLEVLRLHSSALLSLPESFCGLDSLADLELSCLKLSELPRGFGQLSALRSLDVSQCVNASLHQRLLFDMPTPNPGSGSGVLSRSPVQQREIWPSDDNAARQNGTSSLLPRLRILVTNCSWIPQLVRTFSAFDSFHEEMSTFHCHPPACCSLVPRMCESSPENCEGTPCLLCEKQGGTSVSTWRGRPGPRILAAEPADSDFSGVHPSSAADAFPEGTSKLSPGPRKAVGAPAHAGGSTTAIREGNSDLCLGFPQIQELKIVCKVLRLDSAVPGTARLPQGCHLAGCAAWSGLFSQAVLRELKSLSVESCGALFDMPGSVGQLRSLKQLTLKDCPGLTALPGSFGLLRSLEELHLGGLSLRELPDSLGLLRNLMKLSVVSCSSLGCISPTLGRLCNLEELVVQGSDALVSFPPEMRALQALQRLMVADCPKLRCLPEALCQLASLDTLKLLGLNGCRKLPEQLGVLRNLENLHLRGLGKLEFLPVSLPCMSRLRMLVVEDCRELRALPEKLGALRCLEELKVAGCPMLKRLPHSLCALNRLRSLSLSSLESLRVLPCSLNLDNIKEVAIDNCRFLVDASDVVLERRSMKLSRIDGIYSQLDLSVRSALVSSAHGCCRECRSSGLPQQFNTKYWFKRVKKSRFRRW